MLWFKEIRAKNIMSQKMGFKNDMRRIIAAENVMIKKMGSKKVLGEE